MSATFVLEFEKPIVELERKIMEMKEFASSENVELSREIEMMEQKLARMADEIYSKLTRWEKVQLARHPRRPYSHDYINALCTDFIELHGDRYYADDKAVVCGFGKFNVKQKNSRRGRNPQTGKELILDARKVVTFKPSGILRDSINGVV